MNRKVKTHVGRDLIQNGEYFYHPPKAILEYIKNGYNYKKPALNAEVNVKIDITNDVISISDNGRGMSNTEINEQFLVMHGENQDRKKNNPTNDPKNGCKNCGSTKKPITREDDNESAFRNVRLKKYYEETKPLIDYYNKELSYSDNADLFDESISYGSTSTYVKEVSGKIDLQILNDKTNLTVLDN